MEEDNIFMRAAMSKTIVHAVPKSVEYPLPKSNEDKIPPKTGIKKSRTPKLRSTPMEKMLLGEAMKKYGNDFKAVVLFMTKHCEVLAGDLQEYYRKTEKDGGTGITKAKIERVRKISQKKLDTSTFQTNAKVSNATFTKTRADEEFVSFEDEDEDEGQDDVCEYAADSWEETAREIAATDTRYTGIQNKSDRQGVMASLKDTSKSRTEETSEKRKKGSPTRSKSKKKKIEDVLEAMPEMIRLASAAAKDHSNALKKWSKAIGSSESD